MNGMLKLKPSKKPIVATTDKYTIAAIIWAIVILILFTFLNVSPTFMTNRSTATKSMPAAIAIPPPLVAKNQKWPVIVITAMMYNHRPHFAILTLKRDVSSITGISCVIAPIIIMVAQPSTAIWANDRSLG